MSTPHRPAHHARGPLPHMMARSPHKGRRQNPHSQPKTLRIKGIIEKKRRKRAEKEKKTGKARIHASINQHRHDTPARKSNHPKSTLRASTKRLALACESSPKDSQHTDEHTAGLCGLTTPDCPFTRSLDAVGSPPHQQNPFGTSPCHQPRPRRPPAIRPRAVAPLNAPYRSPSPPARTSQGGLCGLTTQSNTRGGGPPSPGRFVSRAAALPQNTHSKPCRHVRGVAAPVCARGPSRSSRLPSPRTTRGVPLLRRCSNGHAPSRRTGNPGHLPGPVRHGAHRSARPSISGGRTPR